MAPAIGLLDSTSRTSPSAQTAGLPSVKQDAETSAAARRRPPPRAGGRLFTDMGGSRVSVPGHHTAGRRREERPKVPLRDVNLAQKLSVQHGARHGAPESLERALLRDLG